MLVCPATTTPPAGRHLGERLARRRCVPGRRSRYLARGNPLEKLEDIHHQELVSAVPWLRAVVDPKDVKASLRVTPPSPACATEQVVEDWSLAHPPSAGWAA